MDPRYVFLKKIGLIVVWCVFMYIFVVFYKMDLNSMETILIISAIVVGTYEVVVRVIPAVGDYTLLGNIIKFLRAVSENLRIKKK